MQITRTSKLSGIQHTREIDVTQEQLDEWQRDKLTDGPKRFIQNALPHLSADDREFLMTGVTPEEWEEAFGPEDG